jgi:tetratricopeptide (TPR) repeat protein
VKAFASGELQEAKSLFEESIGINPNNFRAHWNLARLALIRGENRKALDLLGEAKELAGKKQGKAIELEIELVAKGDATMAPFPISEH